MKIFLFLLIIGPTLAKAEYEELGTVEVAGHTDKSALVEFDTSNSNILKGQELRRKTQTSIGDTLSKEPGVSSTSYGPSSSRPVIRGLDGARLRFLQNGLSSLDASTQSVDHAIPIDPLLVDQIEILRGPKGLLYGPVGIGGVVNIQTNRIHSQFEEGLLSEVQTQYETVNDGLSSVARMDYGKNQWMIHLDGSEKNLHNQKIPGYAHSSHERSNNPESHETKGFVPNSFNQMGTFGSGATNFFKQGYLGASFNHINNQYGSVAEKDVSINMLQNRYEIHGEYRPESSTFKKLQLKSAYTDYKHREIENEATGTIFKNRGHNFRFDAHNESANIRGISGIESQFFDFRSTGEEAFLPGSKTHILSAFTYQEYVQNQHKLGASLRADQNDVNKLSSSNFGTSDRFGFLGLSSGLNYNYQLTKENSLSANYSYTERAPTAQELLSNGAHLATGTFESGSSHLNKEKANSVELNFKRQTQKKMYSLSLFQQNFKNYITLNPTGNDDTDSGLPIYEYKQARAKFWGVEFDSKTALNSKLNLIARYDYIIAKNLNTNEYLPRISPPRITSGLEYNRKSWSHDFDFQYVFEQNKTAPNEQRTSRYILTNIGTQYSFFKDYYKLDLFLRIRNIFDVEARSHVSTLKEIAPLPGRNFILGLQLLL
ncbi:MAG: TonB-dependent receptor [Bacteriovoracaceae bacterium]